MDDDADPPVSLGPDIAVSQDLSTVDYGSKIEKDASNYRVAWSNIMDTGDFGNSTDYQKVKVLLLRWADSSDDMEVKKEVDDLKSVFEERFNFHAEIQLLDATPDRSLQVQVNVIVANFVNEHDGKGNLLIVYYAGHGKPGHLPGQLKLVG